MTWIHLYYDKSVFNFRIKIRKKIQKYQGDTTYNCPEIIFKKKKSLKELNYWKRKYS